MMRNDILWVLDDRGVFTLVENNGEFESNQFSDRLIGKSIFKVFRYNPDAIEVARRGLAGISAEARVDFGGMTWEIKVFPLRNEKGVITGVVGVANAVTDQKLYEYKQQSVIGIYKAFHETVTYPQVISTIFEQTKQLINPLGVALTILDSNSGEMTLESANGIWIALEKGAAFQETESCQQGHFDKIIRSDGIPDKLKSKRAFSTIGIKLVVDEVLVGILWIALREAVRDEDVPRLVDYGEIVANAISRAYNYEQTQLRLKRLAALHEIDRTITNNTDLSITLNIILYHVMIQLEVDAGVFMLKNPDNQRLEYNCSRGFSTNEIKLLSLPLKECQTNQDQLINPYPICTSNQDTVNPCPISSMIISEGFSSHLGAPLIIRGEMVGVLGLFKRTAFRKDSEWFSFLETIATQAAIAVDNTAMYNDLQLSNRELTKAYESTLEGWVRALDLKDKETEGHTQRVANMTQELSRAFGIKESTLPHIRRGALLHDIGKIGIPDKILNKIGPLTDEEWSIMKRHPVYAKNLLSPITFLHQAIDIPYYHHEKWDGTGYPMGLAGTEIPLTARIFAVIDVWDALTTNRSYRSAWSHDKAKSYLLEQSGKHFDPDVVNKFFELGLDLFEDSRK